MLLDSVASPSDLRQLDDEQLNELAAEIGASVSRHQIVAV